MQLISSLYSIKLVKTQRHVYKKSKNYFNDKNNYVNSYHNYLLRKAPKNFSE